MSSPQVIGIAGNSGSGKTTLALYLARRLVGSEDAVVSLDAYYLDRRDRRASGGELLNFDIPDALDLDLLADHLRQLARGHPVERPLYDFRTHTRLPSTVRLVPGQTIIVEGRLALQREDVRMHFAPRVFVTADEETCFTRRLTRDIRERGRTEASVREQWQATVQPMFTRFVEPTRRFADLVVDGTQPVETMANAVLQHMAAGPLAAKRPNTTP